MLTVLLFLGINCLCYALAIIKNPIWAIFAYANVYFNPPDPSYNWWASLLPFHNWSSISTAVLIVSMIVHREKLAKRGLKTLKWSFLFLILTCVITITIAQNTVDAERLSIKMVSYGLICFGIVKCILTGKHFRIFWLAIILMAGNLSLRAYLVGERIHGRLEGVGPSDANGSNEFALLLAGIIPLMIPFLLKGKWYEKLICFTCLPFIINAFVLCNSRGAVIALIGTFIVAIFFLAKKKIRTKMILSGIVMILLFAYFADTEMITRLSSLMTVPDSMSDNDRANRLSSGRIVIWGYGIQIALDYPLGVGPNSFRHLARFYMPDEILTYHSGALYGVRAAHNSYLQVLVEQGYFGLLIWLVMCYSTLSLLRYAYHQLNWKSFSNSFWQYCVFGMGASFGSILLGSLFTSRVYYEFFWWQIALTVVLSSLISEMKPNNDSK